MLRCPENLFLVLVFSLLSVGCTEPDRPTINLYRALNAGDLAQLERHIYWGTDLNQADPQGDMPLHLAARRGRVVMTRLLLQHGADINATNRQGHTPMYVALMAGRTQVAELLYRNGAELDANHLLREVARNRIADRDVIQFLIRHGGDINNPDASGNTALHTAAEKGYRVVARILIAHGADVNAVNASGQTPLRLAMDHDQRDLIDLLRRNGAVLR